MNPSPSNSRPPQLGRWLAAEAADAPQADEALVALFAAVSQPILPFASAEIAGALGLSGPLAWPDRDIAAELDRLERGAPIRVPPVLFRKIEDAQVAEWTERFGGAPEA